MLQNGFIYFIIKELSFWIKFQTQEATAPWEEHIWADKRGKKSKTGSFSQGGKGTFSASLLLSFLQWEFL